MTGHRKRRGMTIVECTLALAILVAAIYTGAQMILAVTLQQREAAQRQIARQEAANQMERMYVLTDEELKSGRIEDAALSETARQRLRGLEATATIVEVDGDPPGKRIAVEIRWTNKAGQPARPARLTAWRFQREATP